MTICGSVVCVTTAIVLAEEYLLNHQPGNSMSILLVTSMYVAYFRVNMILPFACPEASQYEKKIVLQARGASFSIGKNILVVCLGFALFVFLWISGWSLLIYIRRMDSVTISDISYELATACIEGIAVGIAVLVMWKAMANIMRRHLSVMLGECCSKCGYSLIGSDHSSTITCPECGTVQNDAVAHVPQS